MKNCFKDWSQSSLHQKEWQKELPPRLVLTYTYFYIVALSNEQI